MILADVGSADYQIVELLHIVTVLLAVSPVLLHPLLRTQMRAGSTEHQHLVVSVATSMRRLYGPALILAGLFGITLVELSGDTHSLTDGWVIAAIIIWAAMNGVLHTMITPTLRTVGRGQGTPALGRKLERAMTLLTAMFLAQLVLMIWQPG